MTFRKALPSLLLMLVALAFTLHQHKSIQQVFAQTQTPYDCSWKFTFSGNATSTSHSNSSTGTPCVAWRITYSSTGTLASAVSFQTSPDNVTFTAVPNTICAPGTIAPPCVVEGANPTANASSGNVAVRAYDAWTRVVVSGASGTGSGTVTVYGYRGTSASASTGGISGIAPTILPNQVDVNCTNAVGDTAAINAALAVATTKYIVHVMGTCLLNGSGTSLIQITHPVIFKGDGIQRTFLSVRSDVGASTDIISIAGATGGIVGAVVSDMTIQPVSGTPGRNGINIDTTSFIVSNSEISRVRIAQLGGRAIASNNPITNIDGFFTSTIRDCVLFGGINLVFAGDSINIERNVLTGTNAGVELSAAHSQSDPSNQAKLLRIVGNNITSAGGAVVIHSGTQVKIFQNNIESVVATTEAHSALIDIDCDVTYRCVGTEISANLNGANANTNDTIRVNFADGTLIDRNVSSRSPSGVIYRITANATSTEIDDDRHQPETEALVSYLDDLGADTRITNKITTYAGAFPLFHYFNTHILTNCYNNGNCSVGSTTDNGVGLWQINGPLSIAGVNLFGSTANSLEQRNGTNSQNYYNYQSFTDASNYERNAFGATPAPLGVGLYIGTEKAGTGVSRPIIFKVGGNVVWEITAGGVFEPTAASSFSLGTAALGILNTYSDHFISTGAVPGISGCTAGTQTGANTAGTFASGTTGTCTVVLTFTLTAPVGWSCAVSNRTTANLIRQSASTQTTATLVGVTVSGDVISFNCMGY